MQRCVAFALTNEMLCEALKHIGMPEDTEIIGFYEEGFPRQLLIGVKSDTLPPTVEGSQYPRVTPAIRVTERECGHRSYEWDWNLEALPLQVFQGT